MNAPAHAIQPNAGGGFVVKVSGDVEGSVSEDVMRAGFWDANDENGIMMGWHGSREAGAATGSPSPTM